MVIISGASSGIGRAILSRISHSETKAVVFNLSRTIPEGVPNSLNFTHLTCDLSQPADIAAVVSELRKLMPREGRMLLINNSGFGAYGEFPAPGVDHTLKMIDVNVRAPVELTGRLWDELKARGGMIATVASLAGFQPTPLMTTYAATKSFMLDWSVALDAEAKRHGIRCVAICPARSRRTSLKPPASRARPASVGRPQKNAPMKLYAAWRLIARWSSRAGSIRSWPSFRHAYLSLGRPRSDCA